jgi:plastocyanin
MKRTRMRSLAVASVVVGCAGLMAASAYAAIQHVTAGPGVTFSPRALTAGRGDTVAFHNAGGFHGVTFDAGPALQPPSTSAWNASRTFTTAGAYAYFCPIHGGPGGRGMSGVVLVRGPAPVLTGVTAVGQFHAIRVSLRSSQTSVLVGTVYRRLPSGVYRVVGHVGGSVRSGLTVRRLVRTAAGGRFKIVVRARGGSLSSAHTLFATAS